MRKRTLGRLAVLLLCLVVNPAPGTAVADPGGVDPYTLTWFTVDGGGGLSEVVLAPNTYSLYVTIGQPDAWTMSCGDYPISGGFWNPVVGKSVCLHYMPVVVR